MQKITFMMHLVPFDACFLSELLRMQRQTFLNYGPRSKSISEIPYQRLIGYRSYAVCCVFHRFETAGELLIDRYEVTIAMNNNISLVVP